ncbi:hypothetical protein Q1695_000121 [Nippostrongylus brasiliensis]|nr:hypothetical protein Q1695_000121 [Nippostrongylus brasiliensis]
MKSVKAGNYPVFPQSYFEDIAYNQRMVPLLPWRIIQPNFLVKLKESMDKMMSIREEENRLYCDDIEDIELRRRYRNILEKAMACTKLPFTWKRICELITCNRLQYWRSTAYFRELERALNTEQRKWSAFPFNDRMTTSLTDVLSERVKGLFIMSGVSDDKFTVLKCTLPKTLCTRKPCRWSCRDTVEGQSDFMWPSKELMMCYNKKLSVVDSGELERREMENKRDQKKGTRNAFKEMLRKMEVTKNAESREKKTVGCDEGIDEKNEVKDKSAENNDSNLTKTESKKSLRQPSTCRRYCEKKGIIELDNTFPELTEGKEDDIASYGCMFEIEMSDDDEVDFAHVPIV